MIIDRVLLLVTLPLAKRSGPRGPFARPSTLRAGDAVIWPSCDVVELGLYGSGGRGVGRRIDTTPWFRAAWMGKFIRYEVDGALQKWCSFHTTNGGGNGHLRDERPYRQASEAKSDRVQTWREGVPNIALGNAADPARIAVLRSGGNVSG
ncbi:hypothetical protein THAOC_12893 [Thalassiosira oceanica]|uniref:Uncharacterized protein n=1 Tax=Thalassiosira oceanica TaxID=159749 RepID=K0T735_THAOC|nr:hypothetical protein THAOC_12893 [Thalassiosira oceanica]|eukprot:EJK66202.1 hypothetical protein THAOC_12893 [Thalassiosira oceanica]